MDNKKLFEEMLKSDGIDPSGPSIAERAAFEKLLDEKLDLRSNPPRFDQWRILMRSPITKFAAAAMVFIAVILGITFIPGQQGPIALASVIEAFKNATCIAYDLKIGDNAPSMRDTVYGNRIRRETMGTVSIIDLEQQRILTLVPQSMQAITIDMKGLTDQMMEESKNKNVNYVDRLVNLLTELQDDPKFEIEQLEPKEMDGRILDGTSAKAGNVEVIIWTEPDTELPVEIIEIRPGLEVSISNFDFNITPHPSMFSMDPPEGYTMIDGQNLIDFKKDATEENFIKLLNMLAEVNDGCFPQDVSIEYIVKNAMDIGEMIEKNYEGTMKQMEAGMLMGKGMTFLRFFRGKGQWHYAGNGVKRGQVDAPIFWYQPAGSDMYRVIFGDLHVEEVAPEDIETLTADRQTLSAFGYQIWDKPDIVGHQEDKYHVKSGSIIEVHSTIDIKKAPMYLPDINIALPWDNAELLSAKLGDKPLSFEQGNASDFRFLPDGQLLAAGEHVIELIWQFPLRNLQSSESTYPIPLQSLIPVTDYKITAILDADCGFVWAMTPEALDKAMKFLPTQEPNNPRMLTLFTKQNREPGSTFGTCSLCIKPE